VFVRSKLRLLDLYCPLFAGFALGGGLALFGAYRFLQLGSELLAVFLFIKALMH
jgi:hypothetical protein